MYIINTKKICVDPRVDAKTPFGVSISEVKSVNGVISNISTELATGMYYSCWKEFICDKPSDDILSVLPKNMHSEIIRFDDFGIDIEKTPTEKSSQRAIEQFFNIEHTEKKDATFYEQFKQYIDAKNIMEMLLDKDSRQSLFPYDIKGIISLVVKDSDAEDLVKRYDFENLGTFEYLNGEKICVCYFKRLAYVI